jgi:hypothetical protein
MGIGSGMNVGRIQVILDDVPLSSVVNKLDEVVGGGGRGGGGGV